MVGVAFLYEADVFLQEPASSFAANIRVIRTYSRRALIKRRLRVAGLLWRPVPTFFAVWGLLRGRTGGISQKMVDRAITSSELVENAWSSDDCDQHFAMLCERIDETIAVR